MLEVFKKVKYKYIKSLFKFLINPIVTYRKSAAFRLQYRYLRYYLNLPINEEAILYESYHGKNMTCNPYAIFKSLIEDPNFSHMYHIWALNDTNTLYAKEFEHHPRVKFVRVHSKEYLKALAQCKYLINNVTFPPYFQKRKGQVYINTWHGTPLKTLGKDMAGVIGQHANIQRNFLHSDYLLQPNEYTAKIIVDSHDLNGIYEGNIVVEGYPRMDLTLNCKKNIKEILGIDNAKQVILYAPTWRGEVNRVSNIAEEIIKIVHQLAAELPSDCVLLLKVHTLIYKQFKTIDGLPVIFVPDWVDTNELLSVVDVLVTDYSSIFFDYLITKKPIIFFVYDRVLYEKERGLYLELDKMPGPLCYSVQEVIEKIKNADRVREEYQSALQSFADTYSYKDDGFASTRVKEIIFLQKQSDSCYKVKDGKINILMYCGGFLNNGITESAINLLNHIDYSRYNVVVIDKDKYTGAAAINIKRLNPKVKILYRAGSMNVSFKELYAHMYIHRKGVDKNYKFIPKELYYRELLRLIGDVKFDIAVDFSGYVPFWTLLFTYGNFKKRIIYQHNDMMAEYNKKINGVYKHRKNLNVIFPLYSEFDKIVAVAQYTRDINVRNLSEYMPINKAVVVHNCIDINRIIQGAETFESYNFSDRRYFLTHFINGNGVLEAKGVEFPDRSNINFINIGRLSPEKDQSKLLRAFAKIASIHDNVRLYIVGDGVLAAELKKLAVSLNIQDKVYFTGQLTNPFALLNKCDCFILSSNHEGQPMVLLETLVLGKPIIATDIPGSRSILEGGYGELVDNSEAGLVYGMEKFILKQTSNRKFDYVKYNKKALEMFYTEVLSLEQEVEKGENSSDVRDI